MSNVRINEQMIRDVADVLHNYWLVMPNQFIVEILERDDSALATKIDNFGTNDTLTSKCIIDTVMLSIGHTRWPCYGDSGAYRQAFYEVLKERVEKHGGKLI